MSRIGVFLIQRRARARFSLSLSLFRLSRALPLSTTDRRIVARARKSVSSTSAAPKINVSSHRVSMMIRSPRVASSSAAASAASRHRGKRSSIARRASSSDDASRDDVDASKTSSKTSKTSKTSEKFVDLSVDVEAEFKRGLAFGIEEIRPRFTPSAISSADRGLPIADALVATSAQVFVAALALSTGTPRPSWLVPFGPSWRGAAYVLPAIAHGAKLASLWVCGALAARAYERDAFDGSLGEAVRRTLRGGCFATGLLLLVTQSEVAAEFAVKDLGDPVMNASREGDAILYRATSELVVDVVSEATAIVGWRMIRWNTSPTDPETMLREEEERARRRRR